jgi:hypothetical protein
MTSFERGCPFHFLYNLKGEPEFFTRDKRIAVSPCETIPTSPSVISKWTSHYCQLASAETAPTGLILFGLSGFNRSILPREPTLPVGVNYFLRGTWESSPLLCPPKTRWKDFSMNQNYIRSNRQWIENPYYRLLYYILRYYIISLLAHSYK